MNQNLYRESLTKRTFSELVQLSHEKEFIIKQEEELIVKRGKLQEKKRVISTMNAITRQLEVENTKKDKIINDLKEKLNGSGINQIAQKKLQEQQQAIRDQETEIKEMEKHYRIISEQMKWEYENKTRTSMSISNLLQPSEKYSDF